MAGARRRWLLGLLLLGGAVAAAGTTWRLVPRAERHLPTPPDARAETLEPDVVAIVQVARKRVLAEPHSGAAWGALGQTFLANEMEDESKVCFTQAERLDPTNPRWPYLLGGPLLNQGDLAEALPCLQRAVQRSEATSEGNSVPQLVLAETLLKLGRLDEAEGQLRPLLAQPEPLTRAQFDAGLLAAAREDWESARAHFRRCVGHPAARQKASLQLSAICQRLGDQAAAGNYRRQADSLPKDLDWPDPFVAEYLERAVTKRERVRLAEQLEAAGRYAEAAAVLRKLTAAHPDDPIAQLTLGKVLAQLGDYSRGKEALQKALQLAPDKVQAHYYLSLLLLKEGQELGPKDNQGRAGELFREAASQARQALDIKPDYGFAHMALGMALKQLGKQAKALAALGEAVRCNPEYAELHYQLGELLAETGQDAEACSRLEQALLLAPPETGWRQAAQGRVAELRRRAGDKKPARP
jgi:tetratricopeptide (TPR) repeat protein